MLTIVQALKSSLNNARVVDGYRWLVWNRTDKEWQVRERGPYAKKTSLVCCDKKQDVAMAFLLGKR